jgi:hypothetical protein
MIKQLDIIQIKTVGNIKYMSGPPNNPTSPKGNWIVAGVIGTDILATKETTTIRIPMKDVIKVKNSNSPMYNEGDTDGQER